MAERSKRTGRRIVLLISPIGGKDWEMRPVTLMLATLLERKVESAAFAGCRDDSLQFHCAKSVNGARAPWQ